jgi:3-oxoadipate enol-lactonase
MTAVHHHVEGPEGAPGLVLSNSLGTDHRMWDEQARALSATHRVVRYDTRGHGRSPVPPGPYSIDDLGGDVLELLDTLGLERVSFCGLSIGGMTGMWLGVNAPERIDRLVLCCTAPRLGPREQWMERAATVRARGVGAVVEATLERWFTPEFSGRRPEVVQRVREMFLGTPAEGYASCCQAIGDMDLWDALGAIRAPTLVLAGDDDPVGTPEIARDIADAISGARLLVLARARHLANVEQPEAVTRALREHLETEVAI